MIKRSQFIDHRTGQLVWGWEMPLNSFSCLGCIVFLFLFVGFWVLTIKIWLIVLQIIAVGLGIPYALGVVLLIAASVQINGINLLAAINIPIYMVANQNNRVRRELFPIWLLRRQNLDYRSTFQPHTYLGINIAGALIPVALALYQFSRTAPSAILMVATMVTVICYFLVKVMPGRAIYFKPGLLWIVAIITALSALGFAGNELDHASVSTAFAGGVLGCLIGADLLHLKDVQPEKAIAPLSIGAAGLNDGIALCGLYSLLLAEWIPQVIAFLKL